MASHASCSFRCGSLSSSVELPEATQGLRSCSPCTSVHAPFRSSRHATATLGTSLSSNLSIDEFVEWYCSEPRLRFSRRVVLRYRIHLESRHLAPGKNFRLGAKFQSSSSKSDHSASREPDQRAFLEWQDSAPSRLSFFAIRPASFWKAAFRECVCLLPRKWRYKAPEQKAGHRVLPHPLGERRSQRHTRLCGLERYPCGRVYSC